MGLWKAISSNGVATRPQEPDPDLAGRTYAIPFGKVWDAVVRLTAGGLNRWRMVQWDDDAGLVEAEVRSRVVPLVGDVAITVVLDKNAQTRVDLSARKRGRGGDFGTGRRRIRRFLRALDQQLGAGDA